MICKRRTIIVSKVVRHERTRTTRVRCLIKFSPFSQTETGVGHTRPYLTCRRHFRVLVYYRVISDRVCSLRRRRFRALFTVTKVRKAVRFAADSAISDRIFGKGSPRRADSKYREKRATRKRLDTRRCPRTADDRYGCHRFAQKSVSVGACPKCLRLFAYDKTFIRSSR